MRMPGVLRLRAGVLPEDEALARWLCEALPPERVLLLANKAEGKRAQQGEGQDGLPSHTAVAAHEGVHIISMIIHPVRRNPFGHASQLSIQSRCTPQASSVASPCFAHTSQRTPHHTPTSTCYACCIPRLVAHLAKRVFRLCRSLALAVLYMHGVLVCRHG